MKAFRNYLILTGLILGFLSGYILARDQTSYPREIGPQFDPQVRTKYTELMNEAQPEVLFVGDSMLAPAVDEAIVSKRLGKEILLAGPPGTASAVWYLMLKNNIAVAEHKPEYLVLFFRDSMMTAPGYRVTGSYFELIDEYASPDDKLLIERAYVNQIGLPEKLMEAYLPLYGSRWRIRESIDGFIRYSLGTILLGCDRACVDLALEHVFQAANFDLPFFSNALAASDEYLYTGARLNFDDQVGKSLLPEIIRLCEENDIRLILVRMPILRFEEPGTQPAGLNAYVQDLAGYLDKNGVPFFDFDRQDFPSEYFSDSVHLNEQGERVFTEKLVESLMMVIK
jgi:hypothetical protein